MAFLGATTTNAICGCARISFYCSIKLRRAIRAYTHVVIIITFMHVSNNKAYQKRSFVRYQNTKTRANEREREKPRGTEN